MAPEVMEQRDTWVCVTSPTDALGARNVHSLIGEEEDGERAVQQVAPGTPLTHPAIGTKLLLPVYRHPTISVGGGRSTSCIGTLNVGREM